MFPPSFICIKILVINILMIMNYLLLVVSFNIHIILGFIPNYLTERVEPSEYWLKSCFSSSQYLIDPFNTFDAFNSCLSKLTYESYYFSLRNAFDFPLEMQLSNDKLCFLSFLYIDVFLSKLSSYEIKNILGKGLVSE